MVHDSGFVLARPISNIVIRKTDLNHIYELIKPKKKQKQIMITSSSSIAKNAL
jgi:hypothetical protein